MILFKNIKQLLQVRDSGTTILKGQQMQELPSIDNAFLEVKDGMISGYGKMDNLPDHDYTEVIDCEGQMILPTWCDSHTHIVYAGDRTSEFEDRIRGLSYEEIANKGGGILNSALTLQNTSEEELYLQSKDRLEEVISQGTGAVEIKSGYGLTPEAEIKMLRVIQRLKKNFPIPIKATFLGAHALPLEYKERKDAFIDLMINETLPKIAEEGLADYVDVFCEKGYFSVNDMERMMEAGKKYGLKSKLHVNQFYSIGGVQSAVENGALTVDHLEVMEEEDYKYLSQGNTIPVALPGCSYFLSIPYTPGRTMIDKGLPLALASDYNPGSCPSGNMNFMVATACIKMRLTPEEAINAATINGAAAMELQEEVGSITIGKRANFLLTKEIPSIGRLPYSYASDSIAEVYINGQKLNRN